MPANFCWHLIYHPTHTKYLQVDYPNFCKKGYDETDLTAEYCSYCGAPLRNRCSDYSCRYDLDDDACFCKCCGSPSIFYNAGILTLEKIFKSKETVIPVSLVEDELPFN